jgi:hypothetical protein
MRKYNCNILSHSVFLKNRSLTYNYHRIYVFGGGQAQRQRFDDTIKIQLDEPIVSKRGQNSQRTVFVEKLAIKPNSPMPSARTYHASCLVGKYMITIGGEANSDLKDFWALDLDE